MKKLLLLIAAFLCSLNCFADEVVTNFASTNTNYAYVDLPVMKAKGRLYQVKLGDHFTHVTIELTATKNAERLNYWTSKQTYVESGNAKLPIFGTMVNNQIRSCTYEDGWGWNNVRAGEKYYYTLVFSGRIPEGQTNFLLKDYATSGRGFDFAAIINNPKRYDIRDEAYCRENAMENNDGICGIYEEIGGTNSRVACIKENGEYFLIYIGSSSNITWWFTGDLKAYLEKSATPGVFKAEWFELNKVTNDNAYVAFDGTAMKVVLPDNSQPESLYMKMYPAASSDRGSRSGREYGDEQPEWSGTGFALKNNYIVTNYHVIEGARTINIQGVNGDFNKKYRASVVATDKYNDLAILKVEGVNIASASIPYSVKTMTSEVGEDVFVLGYPLTSTMGEEIKLTTGIVSSKTGFQGDVSLYQISAPIQPGNSGGPLFDSNGNVIGIVSAKHMDAENVGYAIKASYLKNLMESALPENVLPQTNKISNYKLSDKVKSVKNYVYYITCSSKESTTYSYDSNYNSKDSSPATKTCYNPQIKRSLAGNLKVLHVALYDNKTVITFSYNNRIDADSYYQGFTLDRNAYIVANGKRYKLSRAEGIAISPEKTYFSYAGETKTFTLYFPAIPKNTTSIDFIESDSSEWQIYGIQLR